MLSLGCEIEFMTPSFEGVPEVPGYEIHREYYSRMWEINSFLHHADTVPKLVHALSDHVEKVLDALAVYDPLYVHAIPIHNGMAFTGIHLHLQDTNHVPMVAAGMRSAEGMKLAQDVGAVTVSHVARNRGLSLRQVASHHIWGRSRPSYTSPWKVSYRFSPCLYNTVLQTYELRFVDFDQILPKNNRKLIKLLRAAFDVVSGVRQVTNDERLLFTLLGSTSNDFIVPETADQDNDESVFIERRVSMDMIEEIKHIARTQNFKLLFDVDTDADHHMLHHQETLFRDGSTLACKCTHSVNKRDGSVVLCRRDNLRQHVSPITDSLLARTRQRIDNERRIASRRTCNESIGTLLEEIPGVEHIIATKISRWSRRTRCMAAAILALPQRRLGGLPLSAELRMIKRVLSGGLDDEFVADCWVEIPSDFNVNLTHNRLLDAINVLRHEVCELHACILNRQAQIDTDIRARIRILPPARLITHADAGDEGVLGTAATNDVIA